MTETVVITCIISLAVLITLVVIAIAVLLYNQMLMTNEINKRLLLMSKETIEHDRATQEELAEAIRQLDNAANEQPQVTPISRVDDDEEQFDPHSYLDEHNTEL